MVIIDFWYMYVLASIVVGPTDEYYIVYIMIGIIIREIDKALRMSRIQELLPTVSSLL